MVTVVSRAAWGARPPRSRTGLPASHVHGGAAHYNGPPMGLVSGCGNGRRCAEAVRGTQRFHMDVRGWSDVAYSFLACPSCGRVYEGRGWGVRTAANGTNHGNAHYFAFMALIGDGEPLTEPIKDAFRWFIATGRSRYGRFDATYHGALKSTSCAGAPFNSWIRAGMPGAPAPTPEPEPKILGGVMLRRVVHPNKKTPEGKPEERLVEFFAREWAWPIPQKQAEYIREAGGWDKIPQVPLALANVLGDQGFRYGGRLHVGLTVEMQWDRPDRAAAWDRKVPA